MSRNAFPVSILAVALVGALSPSLDAQMRPLDAVQWLSGCWERASGDRRTVERWYPPAQGEMRGGSRSFSGSTETGGERLRIYASDGTLVYAAHPSTQEPTEFRAATVTPVEIVFENPAHDFPQRIVYRKQGTDSLLARIEGDRAGRRQPVTFAFRRIDCAGQVEAPADIAQDALQPLYGDLADRLQANPAAAPAWFVHHATPEFTYVNWAGSGYQARVGSYQTQVTAARASAATNASSLRDYSVGVTIQSMLVRGDTAEVLASIRQSALVADAAGRYGTAGESHVRSSVQRRLDRWIRRGTEWRLAGASVIGDETFIDGRLVQQNGRPVTRPAR
jgi:hypothetical protein